MKQIKIIDDGHQLTPKKEVKIERKYPRKRGLIGNLAYGLGMTIARMTVVLKAEGVENIPKQTPYIIAANHETYVDGMLIGSFLPRQHFDKMASVAAMDLETGHGPLGRIILRVGRGIPVDRFGNPVRGLIISKKAVDDGNVMLVHPEGTRSPDGQLGEFKDGASYLSIKSRVPMLPVFLDGAYEVFNRHMKKPQGIDPATGKRREVVVIFGKPFNPADFKTASEMTAALTEWMQARFREKRTPRTLAAAL